MPAPEWTDPLVLRGRAARGQGHGRGLLEIN